MDVGYFNGARVFNPSLTKRDGRVENPCSCELLVLLIETKYTFLSMNDPIPINPSYHSPETETEKYRRFLPHWQQDETWCFVTWRLGDSVPAEKLRQWHDDKNRWLACHPEPWDEAAKNEFHALFSQRFEEWLDQGAGSCLLKDAGNARIVADALLFFCGKRYELATFVVMPNPVHVLFCPRAGYVIADILHS